MKTAGWFVAILAVLVAAGCGGGPDPDEQVRVKVVTTENLNFYDGSAHSVDVYFYKIEDPAAFEAAKQDALLVEGEAVPGGAALERRAIAPDKSALWNVGKTGHERYTHIGVLVDFKEPEGVARMVHEWDDELKLRIDARAILAFTEND
ncbi:MAG: type VI secretion system lipoprotein TssJ [Planctomycetota bacterium]